MSKLYCFKCRQELKAIKDKDDSRITKLICTNCDYTAGTVLKEK